jgi:hypothetical protein
MFSSTSLCQLNELHHINPTFFLSFILAIPRTVISILLHVSACIKLSVIARELRNR